MELKRRFIFHGHAVAIGGRIVRPEDVILDPKGASALAVTGGRTSSSLKATRFGKYVRFASAATLAEGLFDKTKQFDRLDAQDGPRGRAHLDDHGVVRKSTAWLSASTGC